MPTRRTILSMASAAVAGGAIGSFGALPEIRALAQTPARVGLKGYDPVAYFTLSTATPGVAQYEHVYDGVIYRFANAHHRDLFKANPEKYAPQFGGSCAMNLAGGVRREADPTIWSISNGKLYVFAGSGGQTRFREDTAAASRAAGNWEALKDTPIQ
jgi:YHS domain-containing protein